MSKTVALFSSYLCFMAATCASLAAEPSAEAKKTRLLEVEDLYRFDAPITPALSPDKTRLAYVRQWIGPRTKATRHSLWLVEGDRKPRPLELDEPDARSPLFSPDGKWIAFLSTRPRPEGWQQTPGVPTESDPATDIWVIPASGGTAIPLAGPKKPYGRVFNDGFYGHVSFSPDGSRLLFAADDGADPRSAEEKDSGVLVVRQDQGEGYTGYGPAQPWIADLEPTPEKCASKKLCAWPRTTSGTATRNGLAAAAPSWSTPTRRATGNRRATASTRTTIFGGSTSKAARSSRSRRGPSGGLPARFSGRPTCRLPECPTQGVAPRRVQPCDCRAR